MEQARRVPEPTALIAGRVRELRARRGWTADRLAEEMRAVGVGWRRQTVTKLENGYREDVSVAELLALGQVLQCPPVHLIVPPDAVTYRVTAGTELPAAAARDWIRGKTVLPGHEIRNYLAELPREEAEGLWNAG